MEANNRGHANEREGGIEVRPMFIRRLRSSITYANVTSTLALAVALGGGIAWAAVSGTGAIRFGGEDGIASAYETVVALPGVGRIEVKCQVISEEPTISERFLNTSGTKLRVHHERADGSSINEQAVAPGGELASVVLDEDTQRWHAFRRDPDGEPMGWFSVSAVEGSACSSSTAAGQAFGSET